MARNSYRSLLAVIFAAMALWAAAPASAGQAGLIRIDGAIGPATATYISRAIDVAAAAHDDCLIIELDTPGGLLDSTREIVKKLLTDAEPTVVYIAPAGARAASAGTFITLAANVAAMAPDTTIGAAHPVSLTGGNEGATNDVMRVKLENDTVSFIENIATERKHNVAWARSAVLESASITAREALQKNVVDIIAPDLTNLLAQLNGRKIGNAVLRTTGDNVVEIPMTVGESIFQVMWRPEVMFGLMILAIYGIVGELSNPGAILPGVVGGLALIVALYLAAILPINVAGLALILLALALFIVDVFAMTHVVLTLGGIIAFFLGSVMLFDRNAAYHLSLGVIIPATLMTAAFFLLVVGAGLRAQFRPIKAGPETMLGKTVPALTDIDREHGKVFVEGERWNAVSQTPIAQGAQAIVVGLDGLTLQVKPKI